MSAPYDRYIVPDRPRPVGVLAVLRDMQRRHEGGYPLPPFGPVIAAIADLIEADKEYDSAKVAWDALYPDDAAHVKYPKPLNSPEYLRLQRAIARRAAALRAVGGAK